MPEYGFTIRLSLLTVRMRARAARAGIAGYEGSGWPSGREYGQRFSVSARGRPVAASSSSGNSSEPRRERPATPPRLNATVSGRPLPTSGNGASSTSRTVRPRRRPWQQTSVPAWLNSTGCSRSASVTVRSSPSPHSGALRSIRRSTQVGLAGQCRRRFGRTSSPRHPPASARSSAVRAALSAARQRPRRLRPGPRAVHGRGGRPATATGSAARHSRRGRRRVRRGRRRAQCRRRPVPAGLPGRGPGGGRKVLHSRPGFVTVSGGVPVRDAHRVPARPEGSRHRVGAAAAIGDPARPGLPVR